MEENVNKKPKELKTAEEYFKRGKELLESGQDDKALADFKKAIELKSDYAEALFEYHRMVLFFKPEELFEVVNKVISNMTIKTIIENMEELAMEDMTEDGIHHNDFPDHEAYYQNNILKKITELLEVDN